MLLSERYNVNVVHINRELKDCAQSVISRAIKENRYVPPENVIVDFVKNNYSQIPDALKNAFEGVQITRFNNGHGFTFEQFLNSGRVV